MSPEQGPPSVRAVALLGVLGGSVLSALLYSAAFPPYHYSALGWLALVPLFVAVRRGGVWSAALGGLVWAGASAFLLLDAFPAGVATYFQRNAFVAWGFSAFAFLVNGAIYYAVALAVYRMLAARFTHLLPLLAAATWAAAELARGRLLNETGIVATPIGLVAYSQMGWPAVLQVAELTGPYGISFAVVACSAGLAELWLALRGGRGPRAALRSLPGLGLALIPGLAAVVYGGAVLRAADTERTQESAVPVVVVQGHLDSATRWQPESHVENLDRYTKLTQMAAGVQPPRIVFWPEAAITFDLDSEPELRALLAGLLEPSGAELVLGAPRLLPDDPTRGTNSVFALSADGRIRGRYDKEYLLPFAEFSPFGSLDLLELGYGPVRFWEHGEVVAPLPTGAGLAGVLVCNEVMLPQVAARRVRAGAVYLVTPANDGWLGGGGLGEPRWGRLMLDMARLRAIEQRRYVVRASTAGPSAVIDPLGFIRAETAPDTSAVLVGAIRPREQVSLYTRLGDGFALTCALVALAALLGRRLRLGGSRLGP